ncbi:MAG: class I SAM-dependent methyltransferase [Nitrosomonas sp.]|uniref:class I SAM-dependent methyltransferase n=1 Tax=Nitrosomonas sp. TaxID=42353 RepID=UPI001DD27B2B|nr:class I SAM-dependent methyltransferase [Nitrosomonas sp.]MBX9895021.1 class I SAM-dependent methyltransferase [Nitrosomonas sp.]
MNESEIQDFWNRYPCGDLQVGGLQQHRGDYEAFFTNYDNFRYHKEAHILRCLDNIDFKGKQVLEIGLGQGADSEQIIKRGANWSGLDLTPESVARVQTRLSLRQLPYQSLKQGSALQIPYDDNSFDIVFSHGVLHHVPDILSAQREVHRVLKPDGELIVMLYARWSLNYLVSIGILRRLGLLALYFTNYDPGGIFGQHLANARAEGLWHYLRMDHFIHKNTDGPLNPYSKVYDLQSVRNDFPNFKLIRAYKVFMHAPPLPVRWLPLESMLGWHLWVHLRPA